MGGATNERVMPCSWCSAQELLEVEPRHRDDRDPGTQAGVHEHLHAVDVEERQDGDERLVLADVRAGEHLRDIGHEVAVREHHALVHAGRARRVRQHHDGVGVDRHLRGERSAEQRGDRQRALGLAEHEDLA